MSREPPNLATWTTWLERLGDEVYTLHLWRTTWREMIRAAEGNPAVPRSNTHVFTYLAATYGASQVMAIRRLCGEQPREVSFKNLLTEISAHPELVTAHRVHIANVKADLKALHSGKIGHVRKYVNQYVAHRQEIPTLTEVPTFADIHEAIDELGRLLQKYMALVLGRHQMLDPVVSPGWMEPFRVAWMPPLESTRRVGRSRGDPPAGNS